MAQVKPDYSAISETELARLCIARDSEAVRYVLTANNQRLYRAAWSILKDRAEAEEAVQAAYVAAFSSMNTFEGRASLSTWLIRIAINEALGRLRARTRRRAQLDAQGVPMLDAYREKFMRGSDAPSPDTLLAREEIRRLLERAVGDLPEIFRTVFVLREVEGLSVEETAEVIGIQAATVKTRLLRAKRRLQEALAPDVRDALTGTFPFAGSDCAALTERVMLRLHIAPGES